MLWFVCALSTAFFESLKDVRSKQTLRYLDEYWVAWATQVVVALVLLPLLLWQGIPSLGPQFGTALAIGGSLNVAAFLLYVKAIKQADLSLILPLVTLTPVFLLVTSPLILGEIPTLADIVGVGLIAIGAYILSLSTQTPNPPIIASISQPRPWLRPLHWLRPLRTMFQNRGCQKMLLVAFLWSFTSTFDKVGVLNSSPLFWAVALFSYIAMGLTPWLICRTLRGRSGPPIQLLSQHWSLLASAGLFGGIAVAFQMFALTLAPVAQVIAIKRMSCLFGVGFGHLLFGELGWRERLSGAGVMVFGVVVMTVF
ncbi:MAG: EamA family transporter [Alkalinema sp. RL_2_19]|nr:EamA family transporter [Alkalinema sp. RL_2_19]